MKVESMQDRRAARFRRRAFVGVGAMLLVVASLGVGASAPLGWWHRRPSWENLPHTAVRRTDLKVSLTTAGQIETAKKTTIFCELEHLTLANAGQSPGPGAANAGSSTILTLIPEGSHVEQDQVICTLDASEFEELVRQQLIKVEEARAAKVKAEMDLHVAELGLLEFKNGLMMQQTQLLQGQIALAEADIERMIDRLRWSNRMAKNGYVSVAQVITERYTLESSKQLAAQYRTALEVFRKYGAYHTIRQLENQVEAAKTELGFQDLRLRRSEEQLAKYQRQVEHCTIRAPHEGFIVYANPRRPGRPPLIAIGSSVRQQQALFYLPNLTELEVQALIHETVVDRVREGMRARIAIEAMPGQILEGEVTAVAPLPQPIQDRNQSDDVKNYIGHVKLDTVPKGLKPGMSVEVDIVTGHLHDVLVVPAEAVTVEDGHEICYVAEPEGIERREVTVQPGSTEWLEVTEGLQEGEQVVLDPLRTLPDSGETILTPSAPAAAHANAQPITHAAL
jgi:HlyD family secretion protein